MRSGPAVAKSTRELIGRVRRGDGRALRRARAARRLTLRQVASVTGGEFKATSVAGYERGERTISVERFCQLCAVYLASPPAVLAEIVDAVTGATEMVIDLNRLEALGEA